MSGNKEINLFDLLIMFWRKVKHLSIKTFIFLKNVLCLSIKYFWIVIPSIIIFSILGYWMTTPYKTKYNIEGIITFVPENQILIENEFQVLNSLKSNEASTFKKEFNINQQQLSKLLEFKIFSIVDFKSDSIPDFVSLKNINHAKIDTANPIMQDMLAVRIILNGTTDYKPYMDGLVKYFNNRENLLKVDSISKSLINNRIDFCNRELDRLDRFSEYDYFGGGKKVLKTNPNQGIILESSRKNLYYKDMHSLIKERNYLVSYLINKKDVINFTSQYMNITSVPRIQILFIYIIFGFMIGIIISYLIKIHRK